MKDKKEKKYGSGSKRRYQKEALLARMKKSQDQQEGGRGVLRPDVEVTIWRPKDGAHIIDIIPYIVGKNNSEGDKPGVDIHYTFRYFIHKGVGPNNAWVICPAKTWGEDCPICEYRQSLIDKGADWETQVKPLFPKSRNLYNVVCYDRGEEKKGVQVWDVSNHYFEKHIVTLSKKPTRGGKVEKKILFFDEEEGKSISFTIEPAQGKDDYPEYVAHSFEDRDYKISDEILDAALCLDELVIKMSYSEIKKAFFGREKEEGEPRTKRKLGAFEEEDDEENLGDDWEDEDSDDDDDDDENLGDGDELSDLLEDLEEIDDNRELRSFCKKNQIKIKLGGNFKRNLELARNYLEGSEDEDELTGDDVMELDKKGLKVLIKEKGLDLDPRDFDDIEELRAEIIDALELD